MKTLLSNIKENREHLIMLKHTTHITNDLLKLSEWSDLKLTYDAISSPIERLTVSVVNAALTQRRIIFCLTKRAGSDLVKSDKNWGNNNGFNNNKWSQMLRILHGSKVLKIIQKGSGRCPSVYEITCPDILSLINVNRERQLAETMAFANKFKKSDNKTAQVLSMKYIDEEKGDPLPLLTNEIAREILLKTDIGLEEKIDELCHYQIPEWLIFCDWCYDTLETEAAQHVIHKMASSH